MRPLGGTLNDTEDNIVSEGTLFTGSEEDRTAYHGANRTKVLSLFPLNTLGWLTDSFATSMKSSLGLAEDAASATCLLKTLCGSFHPDLTRPHSR